MGVELDPIFQEFLAPDTGRKSAANNNWRRSLSPFEKSEQSRPALAGLNLHGLTLRLEGQNPEPIRDSLQRRTTLIVKRLFDIAGALAALILLGPALAILALAIKIGSPGPVFFRQIRIGRYGQPFTILKFRSMHVDRCDDDGVNQTVAGDDRTTPLGLFMRRHSLDELPQILNVLAGDMALVGPRPYVPNMLAGGELYSASVPYFAMRYTMRPGITGWAQANGYRGPSVDMALAIRRVDCDIAYVQNASLGLDLRIILATLRNEVFGGTGV